jgi:hypothetical protein
MNTKTSRTNSVFLDTANAIALISPRDQFHARAELLSYELEASATPIVSTRAVLIEIGNALSSQRLRHIAVRLLTTLKLDRNVEIAPLSEDLYMRAFAFYRERQDKECGLVDCISFVVMQERGIYEALTSEEYFQQAGFRA